jgi:hypothetical protein
MAAQAVVAGVAGNMMRGGDTIALFVRLDALADLDDDTGDLMTENHRSFRKPIPLRHIAAADAAGLDTHQQLAGADLWHRSLFDTNVVVVIVDRDTHGSHSSRKAI